LDLAVVLLQPLGEVRHDVVPPHPSGEALEVAQGLGSASVLLLGWSHLGVSVNAIDVGPVSLDCDKGESLLLDQLLCDLGSEAIEVFGAVRGFADHHHLGVSHGVQDRRKVLSLEPRKRNARAGHALEGVLLGFGEEASGT